MCWMEEDSGNLSLRSWHSGAIQSWNEAAIYFFEKSRESEGSRVGEYGEGALRRTN